MQKDTKITTGLRCSGVGACICARHECVRAQGLGDLQKGERYVIKFLTALNMYAYGLYRRYANMDYIFFSAILGITLLFLTVSYDIACQWKRNLFKRMQKLLSELRLAPDSIKMQFGIPVWHASAHEVSCQMENGLGLQDGVGRTDGEGIERTWAEMNTMATSTKEMGEGARHDTLDDHFSFHNFEKNIQLGE